MYCLYAACAERLQASVPAKITLTIAHAGAPKDRQLEEPPSGATFTTERDSLGKLLLAG